MNNDESFMREAIKEAEISLAGGGYGIGAVLVLEERIISRARGSTTYLKKDPTEHAEIQLINFIKGTLFYTPENCRKMAVYTTLETCIMCYSTLLVLKIDKIIYGAKDDQGGFTPAPEIIPPIFRVNMPDVRGGVLEEECRNLFLKNREELDRKYLTGELFR